MSFVEPELQHWLVFAGSVVIAMLVDLVAFSHLDDTRFRDAAIRSAYWISVGLGFGAYVAWNVEDPSGATRPGVDYLVAYLVEKSLSVDNLFVFLVVFNYFKISRHLQHRVLFWGITGALVMRGVFIVVGTEALHHFHAVMYLFGAFLVYSGLKLALRKGEDVHPESNPVLHWAKKLLRTTKEQVEDHFFVKREGRWFATPLFLVLLVIEASDVMFAVDSVPAVLAISSHLLVVYSSNIMAILGLRALYFMLAGMMGRFHYLDRGLSAILIFIGAKMVCADFYKVSNVVSLGVIAVILTGAVAASLLIPPPSEEAPPDPPKSE